MPCVKPHHVGGENCQTCVEHQIFKDAAERRKRNGMRNGCFKLTCDAAAVESLENFWQGWVDTLGKGKAIDYLLVVVRNADDNLRAVVAAQHEKHKPVKFTRVSAPRVE